MDKMKLVSAAFTGPYFQGDDHRQAKIALVAGAVSEYSVRLAIEHLIDADVTEYWMLSCTKSLDLFGAKLADVHFLRERYGKRLVATYGWPEALLGPTPPGWDALAARVEAHDRAVLADWLPRFNAEVLAGQTGAGAPMLVGV